MKRPIRVLLAWFDARDAITALLDFQMPEGDADVSAQALAFQQKHRALEERPPYVDMPMAIEPLPAAFAAQAAAAIEAMVAPGAAPGEATARHGFSAGIVDLTRLISFQKAVTAEGDEDRFAGINGDDLASLMALCLPSARVEEDLSGTYDRDGKGVTITSPNPNLRLGALQTVNVPGQPGVKLLGFPVVFGAPHVHVVEYKGRYFLKDGYHRCHGLLRRGINRVPALVQRARSFADVHGGGGSFVAAEHLLGDRPPLLADFLDERVSATVLQRAFRKVVRVRAEEFVINL